MTSTLQPNGRWIALWACVGMLGLGIGFPSFSSVESSQALDSGPSRSSCSGDTDPYSGDGSCQFICYRGDVLRVRIDGYFEVSASCSSATARCTAQSVDGCEAIGPNRASGDDYYGYCLARGPLYEEVSFSCSNWRPCDNSFWCDLW